MLFSRRGRKVLSNNVWKDKNSRYSKSIELKLTVVTYFLQARINILLDVSVKLKACLIYGSDALSLANTN